MNTNELTAALANLTHSDAVDINDWAVRTLREKGIAVAVIEAERARVAAAGSPTAYNAAPRAGCAVAFDRQTRLAVYALFATRERLSFRPSAFGGVSSPAAPVRGRSCSRAEAACYDKFSAGL